MPAPRPSVELKGHCSVVDNDTLYVYSPEAFQALPLKEGGKWQQLAMGVSVTGASCINVAPNTNPGGAALWVVGGSANSSQANYPGLQRYSFADKKWETITPKVSVTQNRQHHSAAYLNQTESILVYAGSQNGDSGPSSQTFLISTRPPYNVNSYTSTAPPVVSPMIMPWNASHAVMVGGGAQNKRVFTFGPIQGWQDFGTSLAQGITDSRTMQSTLITGDDGSKVLEIYNTGISPNEVAQIVLANPDGSPARPGTTINRTPSRKRKRELSLNNWPAYNNTLAPRTTRSDYSIAQDTSGRAVISGGNTDDPLTVFDQRKNTWVNTTALFGGQAVLSPSPSASLSSSSTASATSPPPSSTSTIVVPSAGSQSKSRMLTVLGATLGTIFGIAFVLILILLLFKRRRQRRKRAGSHEYVNEKEDRLSFADRGAEFMHEAGGSVGQNYSASMNQSLTSLAIMQGQTGLSPGQGGQGHKRGPNGSDSSTLALMTKPRSPLGINDPLELRHMSEKTPSAFNPSRPIPAPPPAKLTPRPKPSPPTAVLDPSPLTHAINTAQPPAAAHDPRSRSSGWSRYFAGNDATNLAALPAGARSTYDSQASLVSSSGGSSAASGLSDVSRSQYTESARHTQHAGQHGAIPPLQLNLGGRFDAERFSSVASASPRLMRASREDLGGVDVGADGDGRPRVARAVREGVATEVAKVVSLSRVSNGSETLGAQDRNSNSIAAGWASVPPSSSGSRPLSRDTKASSGFFADDRASGYIPRSNGSGGGPMWHQRLHGTPGPLVSPGLQKVLAFQREPETGRESTVTVFPRGVPSLVEGEDAGKERKQEDMSWLNLGTAA